MDTCYKFCPYSGSLHEPQEMKIDIFLRILKFLNTSRPWVIQIELINKTVLLSPVIVSAKYFGRLIPEKIQNKERIH